jgi:hypothetical protein
LRKEGDRGQRSGQQAQCRRHVQISLASMLSAAQQSDSSGKLNRNLSRIFPAEG